MGMKQQSSVGRVVRKRGVHPRSVCVKFSTSRKIQVKEINEITSRNTLIARKIRNCPFGLSCKYVYLGQNPSLPPSNFPVLTIPSTRGPSAVWKSTLIAVNQSWFFRSTPRYPASSSCTLSEIPNGKWDKRRVLRGHQRKRSYI